MLQEGLFIPGPDRCQRSGRCGETVEQSRYFAEAAPCKATREIANGRSDADRIPQSNLYQTVAVELQTPHPLNESEHVGCCYRRWRADRARPGKDARTKGLRLCSVRGAGSPGRTHFVAPVSGFGHVCRLGANLVLAADAARDGEPCIGSRSDCVSAKRRRHCLGSDRPERETEKTGKPDASRRGAANRRRDGKGHRGDCVQTRVAPGCPFACARRPGGSGLACSDPAPNTGRGGRTQRAAG